MKESTGSAGRPLVAIAGDVTVDWLVQRSGGERETLDFAWAWGEGLACRQCAHPGGAAFTSSLVEQSVAADPSLGDAFTIMGPRLPAKALAAPGDRVLTKTFSILSLLPKRVGSRESVWRMTSYLGEDQADLPQPDLLPELSDPPDHLLLHDTNLGFREQSQCWDRLLASPEPPASPGGRSREIVLASLAPLATGTLWQRLVAEHADRLTLVITGEDLRKEGVEVGYPLSWERVLINVVGAVKALPIAAAGRVVVVLGAGGAVIIERDGPNTLVFDAGHQEGDWVGDYPGIFWGFGLLPCVAGSILIEMLHPEPRDLAGAAGRGLEAIRALHVEGFGSDPGACPNGRGIAERLASWMVRQRAGGPAGEKAFAHLRLPGPPDPGFSILLHSRAAAELVAMAHQAAIVGPQQLMAGVPVETVGSWVSVDRSEIESVRSVRNIVKEYLQNYQKGTRLGRPLSIGVFGPPGAGKSFAVGEIAKILLGGELTRLTFNLSQFQSPTELPQAFHRIRDLVLEQKLPFVFWDEFDAPLGGNRLGWLSSFLEPMQDGVFREAGDTHPIGPAVFVFAGGTCATLAEFQASVDPAADRAAKKLDFISRLRGYLNIFGPNPMGENDSGYPLRRAFLLRSLLLRKAPQIARNGRLNVDEGVLRAFLLVDRFTHGARSVEAIIDQCSLAGKSRFGRSSLPPEDQLALHVGPKAFLDLVRSA